MIGVFFVFISVFHVLVCLFLCLFMCFLFISGFCFSLSRCLRCFRYYVFKVQVFLFLYSAFTCSRVLGCFCSIFML